MLLYLREALTKIAFLISFLFEGLINCFVGGEHWGYYTELGITYSANSTLSASPFILLQNGMHQERVQ